MDLREKNILFIGIGFYDYEEVIKQELIRRGANVEYLNSLHISLWNRILLRFNLKKTVSLFCSKRMHRNIQKTTNDCDIIFIIKGEKLNKSDFVLLKLKNPNAKIVLYLWDSLARIENINILFNQADIIWSFDRIDCIDNPKLNFRPLFYRKSFIPVNRNYYVSFIGWIHSDRLNILRNLKTQLISLNKNYFLKLYVGTFSYLVGYYIRDTFGKNDLDLITLKKISYKQFAKITMESQIIVDISHPLQSGLTMRTIESIAAGCFLLTTNSDIINYKQISTSCYQVIERENFFLPPKVVNHQPNDEFLSFFSLTRFIDDIFDFS